MQQGLRRLPLTAALAACVLLAPRTAWAQQSVAWSVCTPGALNACASVQLSTTALFTGVTRTGTDVTISIHNLNGQSGNDNTYWSGFYEVDFTSQTTPVTIPFWTQSPALAGGATGSASWRGYNFNPASLNGIYSQVNAAASLIGGCTSGAYSAYYATGIMTCGPNAAAVISLSFASSILDASAFDGVGVFGFAASAAGNPAGNVYCGTGWPSPYSTQLPACANVSETVSVTPEPVSMVLMATGLFGVGGVGLRRKKRPLG